MTNPPKKKENKRNFCSFVCSGQAPLSLPTPRPSTPSASPPLPSCLAAWCVPHDVPQQQSEFNKWLYSYFLVLLHGVQNPCWPPLPPAPTPMLCRSLTLYAHFIFMCGCASVCLWVCASVCICLGGWTCSSMVWALLPLNASETAAATIKN